MPKPTLSDLTAFAAVARRRSFVRAAADLEQSPSALSHAIRALETRLGVRLFNRSTRSVALTAAGSELLERLGPVLRDLDEALAAVDAFRARPSGVVRINAPESASRLLVRHVLAPLRERYPEVELDLVTEGRLVDIVAEGFDAGVRLGEAVPQDMVGVRFGGSARFVAVAAPAYLARAGALAAPEDLHAHACIRHRLPSGKLYRWEFERRREEVTVDVPGWLTLNRLDLMVEAALEGHGVAYVPEAEAQAALDDGRLARVLDDWTPPITGFLLYYPGHRHPPPPLRAFIDALRTALP